MKAILGKLRFYILKKNKKSLVSRNIPRALFISQFVRASIIIFIIKTVSRTADGGLARGWGPLCLSFSKGTLRTVEYFHKTSKTPHPIQSPAMIPTMPVQSAPSNSPIMGTITME